MSEKIYRTARKAGPCVNGALKKRGTHDLVNAHCTGRIEVGDRYREGDPDPYVAGGFGKDRVCLGCDEAGLA